MGSTEIGTGSVAALTGAVAPKLVVKKMSAREERALLRKKIDGLETRLNSLKDTAEARDVLVAEHKMLVARYNELRKIMTAEESK